MVVDGGGGGEAKEGRKLLGTNKGKSEADLKMSSGQSVGLLTTDVIKEQNARIKAEGRAQFGSKSSEELGGQAETVYRDKRGALHASSPHTQAGNARVRMQWWH